MWCADLVVLVDGEDLMVLGEGLGQELPELAEAHDADLEALLGLGEGHGRGGELGALALLGQQVQRLADGPQQLPTATPTFS